MTKVISISDEAYSELSRMKNGFSFSKIIVELVKENKKSSIMKFAGVLSKEEGEIMLEEVKKGRKEISRRML